VENGGGMGKWGELTRKWRTDSENRENGGVELDLMLI
jgi:hypothetical protein